jgi:hypothetical protein
MIDSEGDKVVGPVEDNNVIEGAHRGGVPLQLIEPDGRFVVAGQGAASVAEARLDGLGPLTRHLGLGVHVGDGAVDLGLDLGVDVGQLTLGALHFRMARAVAGLEIGQLAADLGALGAQAVDHRRIQGGGRIVALGAIGQLLLGCTGLGLGLGVGGLGQGQLLIEVRNFLFGQAGADRAHQAVGGAILSDGGFGLLDLSAQLAEPVLQPGARLLGRVELGLELLEQIVVGIGVGDLGRLGRVHRFEIDVDDIGQGRTAHGQTR